MSCVVCCLLLTTLETYVMRVIDTIREKVFQRTLSKQFTITLLLQVQDLLLHSSDLDTVIPMEKVFQRTLSKQLNITPFLQIKEIQVDRMVLDIVISMEKVFQRT